MTSVLRFIRAWLAGFSQIILQSNSLGGLAVMAGIGLNSVPALLSAAVGSLVAYLTGLLVAADRQHLDQGMYGYNGALIGIAGYTFLPFDVVSLVALTLASVLSALIMKALLKHPGLPVFTTPFITTFWIVTLFVGYTSPAGVAGAQNWLDLCALGFGQVLFQDSPLSGLLVAVGLALTSPRAFGWSLIAILLSVAFAMLIGCNPDLIKSGLYSYNAVLVVLALLTQSGRRGWTLAVAILLSVVATALLRLTDIPVLTAPFVLVTWLMLGWQRATAKNPDSGGVPIKQADVRSSPE